FQRRWELPIAGFRGQLSILSLASAHRGGWGGVAMLALVGVRGLAPRPWVVAGAPEGPRGWVSRSWRRGTIRWPGCRRRTAAGGPGCWWCWGLGREGSPPRLARTAPPRLPRPPVPSTC